MMRDSPTKRDRPTDTVDSALDARLAAERASEKEQRWYMAVAGLRCLGWAALGILCILWSAHTTSMFWGRIAFYGGIMIGNGGILWTLSAAYLRGERRGYW